MVKRKDVTQVKSMVTHEKSQFFGNEKWDLPNRKQTWKFNIRSQSQKYIEKRLGVSSISSCQSCKTYIREKYTKHKTSLGHIKIAKTGTNNSPD